MRRLTITFSETEAEQLQRMAREERRRPRDQAAYLLAQALRCDAPAEGGACSVVPVNAECITAERQEVGDAVA